MAAALADQLSAEGTCVSGSAVSRGTAGATCGGCTAGLARVTSLLHLRKGAGEGSRENEGMKENKKESKKRNK